MFVWIKHCANFVNRGVQERPRLPNSKKQKALWRNLGNT